DKNDEYPDSKVSIPSLESVIEAKDWVDNGSRT
ncbi:CDIF630_02480 family spore surface protein, partial [Clostridioides difficile]